MPNPRKSGRRVASEGRVLLRAPKKVASCSAGGVEYKVDRDGWVEVDPTHAAALLDHGFSVPDVEEEAEEAGGGDGADDGNGVGGEPLPEPRTGDGA